MAEAPDSAWALWHEAARAPSVVWAYYFRVGVYVLTERNAEFDKMRDLRPFECFRRP
ncbi:MULTISPECIES: hypothetical protein [unclassified Neisseria]|uniref:hypothetical protein n=1 Tax=unclassified Neisseria TaxID=2623750 RepID=UPI001430FA5D|nr:MULTISPECIES: hypothetical protein [unclassified Neisseria]MBF0803449.1 hypothetical protein [Neisseria sp. 19428wB4_WF04]